MSENLYLANVEKQNLSLGHPRLIELFLQVQHEKGKLAYQSVKYHKSQNNIQILSLLQTAFIHLMNLENYDQGT